MLGDLVEDPGIAAYVEGRDAFVDFLSESDALYEIVLSQDVIWRVGGAPRAQLLTSQDLINRMDALMTDPGLSVMPIEVCPAMDMPLQQAELCDALAAMLEGEPMFDARLVDALFRAYLEFAGVTIKDFLC